MGLFTDFCFNDGDGPESIHDVPHLFSTPDADPEGVAAIVTRLESGQWNLPINSDAPGIIGELVSFIGQAQDGLVIATAGARERRISADLVKMEAIDYVWGLLGNTTEKFEPELLDSIQRGLNTLISQDSKPSSEEDRGNALMFLNAYIRHELR